jgi:hypothetical protein
MRLEVDSWNRVALSGPQLTEPSRDCPPTGDEICETNVMGALSRAGRRRFAVWAVRVGDMVVVVRDDVKSVMVPKMTSRLQSRKAAKDYLQAGKKLQFCTAPGKGNPQP